MEELAVHLRDRRVGTLRSDGGTLDEVRALQPAEVYHDIAKGFHARRKQLADA